MKIVSFPHYTCGGLLCDILNNTFSDVGQHGGINSIHHGIGKIGDSDGVFTEFDTVKLRLMSEKHTDDSWIGTHCWLGGIDLSWVKQVINITTMTYRSQLYRWVRAYHHYYIKSQSWQNLTGINVIDKQRETAKNYLQPFKKIIDDRVINIEFSDVVECSLNFVKVLSGNYQIHLDRWQQINHWVYAPDLWSSIAAQRFHEAQYEMMLDKSYVYE